VTDWVIKNESFAGFVHRRSYAESYRLTSSDRHEMAALDLQHTHFSGSVLIP
jgi:hypothetical protein